MGQLVKNNFNRQIRIAIPSDGAMFDPTQEFLASCGLRIWRASPRRYTGIIPSIAGTEVMFQRTADITTKIDEGNADLGFVTYDRYLENRIEDGESILIMPGLGIGQCELVIAVPDSWIDVENVSDLADLSVEFRESGREFRIATKYPRLTERFLLHNGVKFFRLIPVSGALEVAPEMGYADFIADISASGVTLRENRLKTLTDGSILRSEGCLIGNSASLRRDPEKLRIAGEIIERIEAHQNAQLYFRVSANIEGPSESEIAADILKSPTMAGLQGPTIGRVFSKEDGNWFAVTVLIKKSDLPGVVSSFRTIGATSVSVSELDYLYQQGNQSYDKLVHALNTQESERKRK